MTRLLTFIATGLCVVPLCAFAGYFVTLKLLENSPQRGGDMTGMAIGWLGILAGLGSAFLGFAVTAFLASRLVAPERLFYLQIADGIIILAMVIGAIVWNAKTADPPPLDYYGREVFLELELRAPAARLQGEKLENVAGVSFWGGQGADVAHPENAREEGEFSILPVTIHPIMVKEWRVRVSPHRVLEQAALFTLDLPKRPEKSTEWSDWIRSTADEEYKTAEWLTLRYRFRLVPRSWYKEGGH
jgi:hypothetical protein